MLYNGDKIARIGFRAQRRQISLDIIAGIMTASAALATPRTSTIVAQC